MSPRAELDIMATVATGSASSATSPAISVLDGVPIALRAPESHTRTSSLIRVPILDVVSAIAKPRTGACSVTLHRTLVRCVIPPAAGALAGWKPIVRHVMRASIISKTTALV